MNETAQLFFPDDGSLFSRVEAYKATQTAHSRAEASLRMAKDPHWADSLGERQEIEEAVQITRNSLKITSHALKRGDIARAQEEELLTRDEAIQLVRVQRQFDQAARREASSEAKYDAKKSRGHHQR